MIQGDTQPGPVATPAENPPSPDGTAAELSAAARGLFVDGPLGLRLLQRYRPYICPLELVLPWVKSGSRVLDVGCGGGLVLGLLASRGRAADGVGFDAAAGPIDVARRMAARAGPRARLEFVHLQVQDGWPAGEFDAVLIVDVMHHVPPADQAGLIREAAQHVRPGGRLVYKDMGRRPRWKALMNRLHDLALARQWIHYAPIEVVEHWAADAGLRLIHARAADRWWYRHELRVWEKPRG